MVITNAKIGFSVSNLSVLHPSPSHPSLKPLFLIISLVFSIYLSLFSIHLSIFLSLSNYAHKVSHTQMYIFSPFIPTTPSIRPSVCLQEASGRKFYPQYKNAPFFSILKMSSLPLQNLQLKYTWHFINHSTSTFWVCMYVSNG